MMRLFIDSSVLILVCLFVPRHSRDLLLMAARGEITLVVSQLVLTETRRNLETQAPDLGLVFDLVVENIPFEIIRPTKKEVIAASKHVAFKDAAIVAAAKKAKVNFLVTLDKKHLLGRPSLARFAGTKIVTPKEAVTQIRGD